MIGIACLGNPRSIRVLEKNGFRLTETLVQDHPEIQGVVRGIHVLEWRLKPRLKVSGRVAVVEGDVLQGRERLCKHHIQALVKLSPFFPFNPLC